MNDDTENMFQVFDALFDPDQWRAAVEYAKELVAEYGTEIRIYRDSLLVAVVRPPCFGDTHLTWWE